jgi:hypothetical protein
MWTDRLSEVGSTIPDKFIPHQAAALGLKMSGEAIGRDLTYQRSHGYIAVTEFYMRIAYKTWVKAITRLDHKQTPPKRSITQKIYQLSVQGYTPKQIASQIGVTNVYVSVNLFRLRHRSETKPDT